MTTSDHLGVMGTRLTLSDGKSTVLVLRRA
jgi:hypothetical protein